MRDYPPIIRPRTQTGEDREDLSLTLKVEVALGASLGLSCSRIQTPWPKIPRTKCSHLKLQQYEPQPQGVYVHYVCIVW